MIFPGRILIVRTDRIGDVVLSLPLAGIIKKNYPDSKVTFLLREYTKALAEGNPDIDEVLTIKEDKGKILFKENVKMLQERRFDTCIIVYPTFLTSLIIYFSNIKDRIGSGYRWYSFFFNYKVFEHRKYAEKHELEFNVNMLNLIGIDEPVNRENVKFHLSFDEQKRDAVKNLLEQKGVNFLKPVVIVHPGSGGSAVDLPLNKLKELVQRITTELQVKVIVTGSSSEKVICSQFEESGNVINAAGEFDLSGLKSLISLSDIFIANSTGPLHIAAAMGKHVISFYPKIKACSVERWGPYTTKAVVFNPETDCNNCTREQCEKLNCMNTIDVNNIFTEIEKIFKFNEANLRSTDV